LVAVIFAWVRGGSTGGVYFCESPILLRFEFGKKLFLCSGGEKVFDDLAKVDGVHGFQNPSLLGSLLFS
jgi:hypothetical protein